jgi:diadenosine tetraphosphatase ApaH/serine/threonine PP2A family protein phosphatase
VNRTIVIGDLHGCFDETVELISALQVTSSDRVIFAGDLVDRGPKPRECVELAMQHECVLGNHEEKHLQQRRSPAEKLSPAHLFTREQLGDEHYAYFEKLPLFLRLPEFNSAVVHAGAFPGVPLEQQKANHLLHIQHIKPPTTKSYWPSKAPVDYSFWTNFWRGPERLIFGHSVLDRPLVTPWAVGVDTGAVFGRGLTALVLPDWELKTVVTRDYSGGRKTVASYPVQGGVMAFS